MAITLTVDGGDNHVLTSSKPVLARQSEIGETLTVDIATGLNAVYPKAYIFYADAQGRSFIISNGGVGFTYDTDDSFDYVLGSADTIMTYDGPIKLQIVLTDADLPNQTKVWRSKVLQLTVDSSIVTSVDSIAGIADLYETFMLGQIYDVNITSPVSNGEILAFNSATDKWENKPNTSGSMLAGLDDVDVSTKADNDFLQYDAGTGKWVPAVIDFSPYAEITDINVANSAYVKTAINASGSAPIYACRAWCEFDGTLTGTNAPTAGGNITSIQRNSAGDYTINFTTALPTANYSIILTATQNQASSSTNHVMGIRSVATDGAPTLKSTSAVRVVVQTSGGAEIDLKTICVAVFC